MVEPLPAEALRWRLDPSSLPFETTAQVEPIPGVIGQAGALEALRFGLECKAHGQNVFVRGLTGSGRMTMVQRLLEEMKPTCSTLKDCCYVHNFEEPERPRLIVLPPGRARVLRRRVHDLADFLSEGLKDALTAEGIRSRTEALERRAREEVEKITKPFEEDLKANELAMVTLQVGPIVQNAIFPVVDGKPVPPEEFEHLRSEGKVTEAQAALFKERSEAFQKRLAEVTGKVGHIRSQSQQRLRSVVEEAARAILAEAIRPILAEFHSEEVAVFLNEVVEDVVENQLGSLGEEDYAQLYRVHVLLEHDEAEACPIIVENSPTVTNLLGAVEHQWTERGPAPGDHTRIVAGSLLRADGGYLILEARDVLVEPGAWKVLVRTLRTGKLEIVPSELALPWIGQAVKPHPIPISVKVILLGDAYTFALLDTYDPDFGHQFKVLADFDSQLGRTQEGVVQYAGVLARIAKDEDLLPFDRTAVAALAEHGARIVARREKLTARFGRVADIAREAAFLAAKQSSPVVSAPHVGQAVARTKARADLPSRRFREYLADGTILVDTQGKVVGQVNGLAVIHAGPLTYGFPARITATIGAGTAGVINIEREAALSGAIHTKGFYILGGLMRHLLQTGHPLAFSASVAFEQSYGGIDGDSASGAEICALLSALTDLPIRQDLAMTGAIDQMGHVLAIGGVNEKIEGFFDTCKDLGLTGGQGVLIPLSNAGDLMLRSDVVEACRNGKFHVYPVETIQDALGLLTGVPAGERGADGLYPEGTLLRKACERAGAFWRMAAQKGAGELPAEAVAGEEENGSEN